MGKLVLKKWVNKTEGAKFVPMKKKQGFKITLKRAEH
jgi:hypothetical protein